MLYTINYLFLTLSLLVVTFLLMTFANSLDPDQDPQNVSPDQVQKICHSNSVPERIFWKR